MKERRPTRRRRFCRTGRVRHDGGEKPPADKLRRPWIWTWVERTKGENQRFVGAPLKLFQAVKKAIQATFFALCAFLRGRRMVARPPGHRCVILGKVVDATTNEALPFASVVLQGNATGTTTDFDGNYTLTGTPGVHNVVVSFLGYATYTALKWRPRRHARGGERSAGGVRRGGGGCRSGG